MKTQATIDMENAIYKATAKQGVFTCFEVTIGWYGKERVDYMTYDTKGIFRCYEIKVTKSDFNSNANISFVGDYNYYVMPVDLYEEVKEQIPDWVGVYCGLNSVKKAKRRKLEKDRETLKDSLLRSIYREAQKARNFELGLMQKKILVLKKELKRTNDELRTYGKDYKQMRRYIRQIDGGLSKFDEWSERSAKMVLRCYICGCDIKTGDTYFGDDWCCNYCETCTDKGYIFSPIFCSKCKNKIQPDDYRMRIVTYDCEGKLVEKISSYCKECVEQMKKVKE